MSQSLRDLDGTGVELLRRFDGTLGLCATCCQAERAMELDHFFTVRAQKSTDMHETRGDLKKGLDRGLKIKQF